MLWSPHTLNTAPAPVARKSSSDEKSRIPVIWHPRHEGAIRLRYVSENFALAAHVGGASEGCISEPGTSTPLGYSSSTMLSVVVDQLVRSLGFESTWIRISWPASGLSPATASGSCDVSPPTSCPCRGVSRSAAPGSGSSSRGGGTSGSASPSSPETVPASAEDLATIGASERLQDPSALEKKKAICHSE